MERFWETFPEPLSRAARRYLQVRCEAAGRGLAGPLSLLGGRGAGAPWKLQDKHGALLSPFPLKVKAVLGFLVVTKNKY